MSEEDLNDPGISADITAQSWIFGAHLDDRQRESVFHIIICTSTLKKKDANNYAMIIVL